MKQTENVQSSLPEDIALKIASRLQVSDVCSLGSCSRYWRELCGSDFIWAALSRERWPAIDLGKEYPAADVKTYKLEQRIESNPKVWCTRNEGWKRFYINRHKEMAGRAASVVDFVEQCSSAESIEVGQYLAAIEELSSMQFGFKDVQLFLFKPKLNALLNLVGLHYAIGWLGVPAECVMEALDSCNISERELYIRWWKLGRWFYGFRLRDEAHSRKFSLGDLAMAKEEEILGVLHRGAIHEVLRVQISVAKPTCTPWSCQSTPR